MRYVEGGEDLYRTLACFHLSKPYAALMVDDLDLILLRGGEEAKKKSAARERGSAFGATEARLARASIARGVAKATCRLPIRCASCVPLALAPWLGLG